MRGILWISVFVLACGVPPVDGEPDAGDDGGGKGLLRYALEAVEAPASAPVATDVGVVATVTATPAGLRVLPGAQATSEPAAGVLVNFRVVSGGGQVYAGTALTNSLGQAREIWTLGTTAGEQVLEARAVDPDTGAPVVYASATTTGLAGAPVNWNIRWRAGGMNTTFAVGASFDAIADSLLWAQDQYWNLVAVEQTQTLVGVHFSGNIQNGDPPTCSISGTVVTCPPSRSANFQAVCDSHCWNGSFWATYETNSHLGRVALQFLVE